MSELFGAEISGGPLDDVAHLLIRDAKGRPIGTTTVPIEVKNVRHWIYPDSQELFQLLDKAARLQLMHPDLLFLLVLVCRRAHYTTFRMAKDLGFFVADAHAQFILPRSEAEGAPFEEVRASLGFTDLVRHDVAYGRLVRMFENALVTVAASASGRFKESAALLSEPFQQLRSVSHDEGRAGLMNNLRATAKQLPNPLSRW